VKNDARFMLPPPPPPASPARRGTDAVAAVLENLAPETRVRVVRAVIALFNIKLDGGAA
jgi:hypothetical protein